MSPSPSSEVVAVAVLFRQPAQLVGDGSDAGTLASSKGLIK